VLADYFDLLVRHREVLAMVVRDLATLAALDLVPRMIEWRRRLMRLLIGPRPSLVARARAVVAVGGMSDCVVEFVDVPLEKVKSLAVDAACAALGVD
jgi:hypothetical protein